MTKKECLEDGYYSEEFFVYLDDGWISDIETGELVARFSFESTFSTPFDARCEVLECKGHPP